MAVLRRHVCERDCDPARSAVFWLPGRTLEGVSSASPPPDVSSSADSDGAIVDVVGVAIVDDLSAPTRLLGARRVEPSQLAGFWELPGGKVEPGESWQDALHREIAEEIGVRIELGALVPGPLPDRRWALSTRHRIAVWLARVVQGEPAALDEHDAVRWLTARDLHDVPWLPGDVPIVEAIVAAWTGPRREAAPGPARSEAPPPG